MFVGGFQGGLEKPKVEVIFGSLELWSLNCVRDL